MSNIYCMMNEVEKKPHMNHENIFFYEYLYNYSCFY